MTDIQNAINQILAHIAAIISGATPANTNRNNPEWANQLDELNLSAITTAVPGTSIDTLAYDKITAVPHTRGDEPYNLSYNSTKNSSSPHTWG